jgi:hypothetical protein
MIARNYCERVPPAVCLCAVALALIPVGHAVAEVPQALFEKRNAQFDGAPLKVIIDDFRSRDKFNIIVRPPEATNRLVYLYVHDIPRYAVVQYVARAVGLKPEFSKFGATFTPRDANEPARSPQPVVSRVLLKKTDADFENATLHDILQFCIQVHGLNVVYVDPAAWRDRTLSLSIKGLSVLQLVNYVGELGDVPVRIDKWAVIVGERRIPEKQGADEQSATARPTRAGPK